MAKAQAIAELKLLIYCRGLNNYLYSFAYSTMGPKTLF